MKPMAFRLLPDSWMDRSRLRALLLTVLLSILAACLLLLAPVAAAALYAVGLGVALSAWVGTRSGLGWTTVVFLMFLTLLMAFGRDFSYLSIDPGMTPLFVTEIAILILLPGCIIQVMRQPSTIRNWRSPAALLLTLYVIVGMARLPWDLARHGLDAARDAVLVYYAVFAAFAMVLISSRRRLRLLLLSLWLGALAATLVIVANAALGVGVDTSTSGIVRYGAGIQALSSTLSLLVYLALRLGGYRPRYPLLVTLLVALQMLTALLLVQHRSQLLATAAGLLLILLFHPRRARVWGLGMATYSTIAILGLLLLSGLVPLGDNWFLSATVSRARGAIDPQADFNVGWRLAASRSLFEDIRAHPLTGNGFGQTLSFRFESYDYDDFDPHNSFVAILYRLGLPATLCLFGAMALAIVRSTRLVRKDVSIAGSAHLGILASFVALTVFAMFNVVLEGPYMGIFFWLALGILIGDSIPATNTPQAWTEPQTGLP